MTSRKKNSGGGISLLKSKQGEFLPHNDKAVQLALLDNTFVSDPGLPPGLAISPPTGAGGSPGPRLAAALPTGTTRQPIANPNDYPWCAHVRLLMRLPDDSREVATGWMIGPRTIITSGHCVYDGGWMRSIEVKPGGADSTFDSFPAIHFNTTNAWINATGENRQKADLGVVYLQDAIPGHPGPLRYAVYSDAQLGAMAPNTLSVAGFPANPFGTFLFDRGSLLDFNAPFLQYDVETSKGVSGAPVLHWGTDGIPTVIGVHHFNVLPNVNRALRIGPPAASLLLNWTH
jgi:glutamyl endopeptidase